MWTVCAQELLRGNVLSSIFCVLLKVKLFSRNIAAYAATSVSDCM